MQPDPKTVTIWRHHWRDETDAAFLYRELVKAEPDPKRKDVYERLAKVEDSHVDRWKAILEEHGEPVGAAQPSLRARTMAWLARRVGPGILLSTLTREEGEEVKGYLSLYQTSEHGTAKDTALTLAKESAVHAEDLQRLSGGVGEPWHQTASGGFLRNVVYGFNDGLTANFGLVAGVIGAGATGHASFILVSGMAGMIADSLSMASSGYLAAKSELEVYAHEIAMEKEEIKMMPEVEEEELALIYESKGINADEARTMAKRVMASPERALEEKVREELKIGEAHSTPLKEAWVTGVATAIGAFLPVAPFFVLHGAGAVWTAFILAMVSHFAVGAARSVFTGRGFLRSGVDMFVVGLGVAGVSYVVGDLVVRLLPGG